MSKKSFIDSVEVTNPCTEDWEQMHGNDRVRFCDHCAKDVKNLSAVTRKEAMRLVRASSGNLCIRYLANPVTRRPMFAEQLLQITRRAPGLAAGVMSASLSLSTMAYAQEETPSPTPTDEIPVIATTQENTDEENDGGDQEEEQNVTDVDEGSIEGTIWDFDGKPVPGVMVYLYDAESSEYVDNETTDNKGRFLFKELDAGVYLMRIYSANGVLKKAMPEFTLTEGQRAIQNLHVTLVEPSKDKEVTISGWGGAMATVAYSLPLSQAVAQGDISLALDLIEKGAKVDDKDTNYDDITPLFLAVENGNLQMAKLLLDHGANVNAKDNTKRTPLMFIDGDATPELIELLLQAGAKVNFTDKNGNTVLLQAIRSINLAVLNALISAGVDINKADDDGDTPLIMAADDNKLDLIKALVLAGAEVNAQNNAGETAWDKTSSLEIEEFLEQYGAVTDYGNITVVRRSTQKDEPTDN